LKEKDYDTKKKKLDEIKS